MSDALNHREDSDGDGIDPDARQEMPVMRSLEFTKARLTAIGVLKEGEATEDSERNLRVAYLLEGFRYLNDASYKALIDLSKQRIGVKDIIGKAELEPLVDLVVRASALIEIDRGEYARKDVEDPRLNAKDDKWFVRDLVVLSRIYAPDMGITVVDVLPDKTTQNYYDPTDVTGIMVAETKIGMAPIGAKPVKAIVLEFPNTPRAMLLPGKSLTVGSNSLTKDEALGNTIPEPLRGRRNADMKIADKMVSRASIKLSLDTTGTQLTVIDCGTKNNLTVLKKGGAVKYDAGQNQSGILSPEQVAELRRRGLMQ
jgi:hypothetical protein